MRHLIILFLLSILPSTALPEESEEHSLLQAVTQRDVEKVRSLLQDPKVVKTQLDPTCPPSSQCKPVSFAAENGSVGVMKLLLDAGADINGATTGTGDTPLIIALIHEHRGMVDLLLERGADPNLPNQFGATPFWGGCGLGDSEAVLKMIKKGAKIDQPGRLPDPLSEDDAPRPPHRTTHNPKEIVVGITPLMLAASEGHREVVKVLIEAGANTRLKDSKGRSYEEYASKSKDSGMKKFIEDTLAVRSIS